MTSNPYAPEDPTGETWDAVVVGTGMGGATAGYALARSGKRVLFLEQGLFLYGGADRGDGRLPIDPDERPEGRLRRGWWPLPIQGTTNRTEMEFFAPLGCGSGGSTGLFAAQLERLNPVDFQPRKNFPQCPDSTLPDSWPISYEELAPYFRQAEDLFRVRGTQDPLNPDPEASLREPPPLSARDQNLFDCFRELGLHPYRAHVACEYLPGCEECVGVLCPRGCRNDAGRICLIPALERHGARVLSQCEVVRLEADKSSVRLIDCRWKGTEISIKARIVILAAGAFRTPILLLNSSSPDWPNGLANRSGGVGRNLMLHVSDFIAIRHRGTLSSLGPQKVLSLNDFYLSQGVKLGTLQSVGIRVNWGFVLYFLHTVFQKSPRWRRVLIGPFLRIAAYAAGAYFSNSAIFSTIVEDLPYWDNRVYPDAQSKDGMRFEYRYPKELRDRSLLFRKRLAKALRPRCRIMVLTGDNNLNFGHPCGTCRFGDDPATSVLDRNNRAHDVDNLYVVDASFFPSSGGTNPTLTIAANALRVAEAIERQLSTIR